MTADLRISIKCYHVSSCSKSFPHLWPFEFAFICDHVSRQRTTPLGHPSCGGLGKPNSCLPSYLHGFVINCPLPASVFISVHPWLNSSSLSLLCSLRSFAVNPRSLSSLLFKVLSHLCSSVSIRG